MILREAYPELYAERLWTGQDDETYSRFMQDLTPEKFQEITDKALTTREIGGRAYRLFVDTPPETDGSVIVIPGEFAIGTVEPGQGRPSGDFRRSLAIREIVNPAATVAVQPNDTRYENNLNLSREERATIRSGYNFPIVDRLKILTDDYDSTTMVALSQGATVATDYAANFDRSLDAISIVEAPNVIWRNKLKLVKAFGTSGDHLHDNFAVSGLEPQTDKEKNRGLRVYARGIPTRSNLALLNPMMKDSLSIGIERALAGGAGVTHSWASRTDLSPSEANKAIAHDFETNERYESYEFFGDLADHSITNVYQLVGAVTRRAIELGSAPLIRR